MTPQPPAAQDRLPSPYRDESSVVAAALTHLGQALDWASVVTAATPWVNAVRENPPPFWAMESLLKEYPISSAEGLALMRLAEALLRVPDAATAIALTADQLGRADFEGDKSGLLAGLSNQAIALAKKMLPQPSGMGTGGTAGNADLGLMTRLGAKTVVAATVRAVSLLGRQFVLGQTILAAQEAAAQARRAQPNLRFSYDMLGEGARTQADADLYFASYLDAIKSIANFATDTGHNGKKGGKTAFLGHLETSAGLAAPAQASGAVGTAKPGAPSPEPGAWHSAAPRPEHVQDGISIKLSALHPRYEWSQRSRVMAELVPRVWTLCEAAARARMNLTIDAEEVDRLELSLDVLDALCANVSAHFPDWQGLGLALQAYQTRSLELIGALASIAKRHGVRLMCRLVKGAYWDAEVKRAQELGLAHYPVFTHKHHTDIAYLACAQALLANAQTIYPQFATHNAGTIAAIAQMAHRASLQPGAHYELQRLHGMGEGVYREVLRDPRVTCRVYAPVGSHRDLLAYLVRRLLENGANASFVHQLADESVTAADLLLSPLRMASSGGLTLPAHIFGASRINSSGLDLAVRAERSTIAQALVALAAQKAAPTPDFDVKSAVCPVSTVFSCYHDWSNLPVHERAHVLRRAADALSAQMPHFCALLITEAHKTWGDAVAEVREAVDFLRYYAAEAERVMAPAAMPAAYAADAGASGVAAGLGVTGESNTLTLKPRGVWLCISPWNFPLAIFLGQVAAALATGNGVVAKPAPQTPRVALAAAQLLYAAGLPRRVLEVVFGGGFVGAHFVNNPIVAGVVFTGSTAVARSINRALAAKDGPITPLIAETGGINAMVVDSSALPEQVVDAAITSAFKSAGQRCSALRLLCVHAAIADKVIEMLHGAAAQLRGGDPVDVATDVGPVIDAAAFENIQKHLKNVKKQENTAYVQDPRRLFATKSGVVTDNLIPPTIIELASIDDLGAEVFGPVLHVLRWGDVQGHGPANDPQALMDAINGLGATSRGGAGYGLTLGIQTRIDSRAQALAQRAHVGNVYINRNMTGAVVGLQPFGGEGLSGTGPKAGGPHYLVRFCTEQTVTVNLAAAGGNVALMAG